ncbi:MAG: hypothetical protein WC998_06490 [Candidatus Paceibacterota bacterium]|jgi:hypothetical protein
MKNDKLFQYLLWGFTTMPKRFSCASEFSEWAEELGYDNAECIDLWSNTVELFKKLYTN